MSRVSYQTANELLRTARDCGLDDASFHQVPGGRAAEVLDQIFDQFTREGRGGRTRYWLWNDLREPCAFLPGKHELEILASLAAPSCPVWLVAEDDGATKRGTPFWLFEATLSGARAVLGDHHLLEFYIVARSLSWLVGENHHGLWFAAGDAGLSWLQLVSSSAADAPAETDPRATQNVRLGAGHAGRTRS